ncbi:hypothetical protein B0H14DRAFT_3855605 [Mycena olivaceomarginata]|nr:hypothetical protein B0H14DRAFT_3855605 [Mycena olivaceomarginata]
MGEPGREEERSARKRKRSVDGSVEWTEAWTGTAAQERHYLLRGFAPLLEAACGQLHAALVYLFRWRLFSLDTFLTPPFVSVPFTRTPPGYNHSGKLGQINFLDGVTLLPPLLPSAAARAQRCIYLQAHNMIWYRSAFTAASKAPHRGRASSSARTASSSTRTQRSTMQDASSWIDATNAGVKQLALASMDATIPLIDDDVQISPVLGGLTTCYAHKLISLITADISINNGAPSTVKTAPSMVLAPSRLRPSLARRPTSAIKNGAPPPLYI